MFQYISLFYIKKKVSSKPARKKRSWVVFVLCVKIASSSYETAANRSIHVNACGSETNVVSWHSKGSRQAVVSNFCHD